MYQLQSTHIKTKMNYNFGTHNEYLYVKNLFILSVCISSYGCTREVWRARKMLKSWRLPCATLAS